MTGKRFEFREAALTGMKLPYVYDKNMQEYLNPLRCVNLLNEIVDENERLKKKWNSLSNKKNLNNIHSHKKIMGLMEANTQLREENEQLEQLCETLKEKIHFYENQFINPECPVCHTILEKISIDPKKDRYYRVCLKCGYEREESLI